MLNLNLNLHIGKIHTRVTPPQGMTSLVVILNAEQGDFALKQSQQEPYTSWLRREAFVLKSLAATNLPLPRFVALHDEPKSVSLLMTALPGEPLSALLRRGVDDEVRRNLLRQFGTLLSLIHSTPPSPEFYSDMPWLLRITAEASQNLALGYAESGALPIEQMLTRLPPPTTEVLIHGDYTIDNVLVDEGTITGVIDWGRGDSGDRRYDLALATRPQQEEAAFLGEPDFAAFYGGYGGERLNADENQWFNDLYEYF